MNVEDVITYVFARLGHEYDSLVASILAQTDTMSLEEIYSLLLTIEARISHHQLALPTSVHIAQK